MKGGEINENAKREEVKSFVISATKSHPRGFDGGRGGSFTSNATAAKPQRNGETLDLTAAAGQSK